MVETRTPTASAIVPTYQRRKTIGETIASLLVQSFSDLEVVVVDDGSTDGTRDVVERFADPRVCYFWQPNAGRSAARNRGAAAARGDWLAFVDSDDVVAEGWLAALLDAAQGAGAPVACCGARIEIERPQLGINRVVQHMPDDLGPVYFHRHGLFLAGTYALRRRLFTDLGGFDEQLSHSENTDLALRLAERSRDEGWTIACVAEPLLTFRNRRPAEDDERAAVRLAAAERILERHGERYYRLSPGAYADYRAIAGIQAARTGQFHRARGHLLRAISAAPWRFKNYLRLAVTACPPLGRRLWRSSMEEPS